MNDPKKSSGPSPLLVVGAVVVLVLVAAVVAIIVAGGGDGNGNSAPGDRVQNAPVASGLLDERIPDVLRREVRPVEIEGDPLPPFVGDVGDPAVGMRPPTIYGESPDGVGHTVSADIAEPTLLVFLAHWCPACNEELPVYAELARTGALPDDLDVYAVLTSISPGRPGFPPAQWLADGGWAFDTIVDMPDMDRGGEFVISSAYGLTSTPFTVLIDGGVVVDRWSGVGTPDEIVRRVSVVGGV
jgi:thiol-disulfide isomerase/thioredoxin